MKTNGNLPIIPTELMKIKSGKNRWEYPTGLSKREYFAAMAMQGLCANSIPGSHHRPGILIPEAIQYADALIEELNKSEVEK